MSAEFKELIMEMAIENGWFDERIEKRKLEEAKKIAERALLLGFPVEDISKATKLPIETVLGLQ